MSLVIEERADGSIPFSLDGDLQFDSRDEAIYHENLVLPALTLARKRGLSNLRVLICGGGDGLALREVLRFPDVASVDLVDLSAEVVELGKSRFADLNEHAFEDSRVSVHIEDAWGFLATSPEYDVIVADFSVPRRSEDARIFTAEWYASAKAALVPLGVIAINAVSPQLTPAAFWCQVRSVRAAGLRAVPYRSCIPSFRDRGYGAWGAILASAAPVSKSVLRGMQCPVGARQANLQRLWRGARFSRAERMLGHLVPVHRLERPCLVHLMLNGRIESPVVDPWSHLPQPLKGLFEALPVSHPYHTRLMVQSLAECIVGDLSRLRLRSLLDELLRRAARLPKAIADELLAAQALRCLNGRAGRTGTPRFSAPLFSSSPLPTPFLRIMRSPRAPARSATPRWRASGSFGRSGSFGSNAPVTAVSIHGGGFRSSTFGSTVNGHYYVSDMEGDVFPSHVFYYNSYGGYGGYGGYGYGYGYGTPYGNGNAANQQQPPPSAAAPHTPVFAADDDLLVMDNGDLVITLTQNAYLVINGGRLELVGPSKKPLLSLALDADFAAAVQRELDGRRDNARSDAKLRRDWLSWVNWTAAILPSTKADQLEVGNLDKLEATLLMAKRRLGGTAVGGYQKPDNATLLFQSCFLYDSSIQFRLADGTLATWDGAKLTDPHGKTLTQTSPELKDVFKSILAKVATDLRADERSNAADLAQINVDEINLRNDEQSYRNLQSSWGPDYAVDYGTDEISASLALAYTERDLTQNAQDRADNAKEANQIQADTKRIASASQWFK